MSKDAPPPSAPGISDIFQRALECHQQGRLASAETLYRSVLAQAPGHFDALHLLGVVQHQKGQHAEAAALIAQALGVNPQAPAAYSNLGNALQTLGRANDALAAYDRALQLQPDYAEALYNRGNALRTLNRREEALASYKRALRFKPDYAEALYNSANLLREMARTPEALGLYDRALQARPDYADALNNRGNALQALNRAGEALASYDRALHARPDFPDALNNRGNLLREMKHPGEALESYDRALRIVPDFVDALNNRGHALLELKRYGEALESYERALELKPNLAEALFGCGCALSELSRAAEALAAYDRALRLNPGYAQAHNNRGNVLRDLERTEEALAAYDRALERKPDFTEALNNRGMALLNLKRYGESAKTFSRLLELSPDYEYAAGYRFHTQLQTCDWADYATTASHIATDVERGEKRDPPFSFLAHSQSAAAQLVCARNYVADKYPASPAPVWAGERYAHEKIRVAYLSADFHNHATAYLMAGLFETHDAAKFEVSAISFGPGDTGGMRQRLQRSFHRFVDARQTSDRDIARLLREMEIDIAIDLKGFTKDCRPGIFAHRGAPVQVSYLGYPGTMGAEYIDYILADSHIVPPGGERFYAEKVARLPDSYQVNDRKRRIAERTPSRSELGLPNDGFVFCCFNNNYKITPFIFDIWMRLLKRIDGSVLWLLQDNADASRNLIREAESRGVAANRLVFAQRLDLPDHLARHRCADLFLDTLPCNAHTTASDALWAGLPLLTCMGETFASRVAGSLLHAAGLPELATRNLTDYEALAFQLATAPEMLSGLKARLARTRDTCPLFDTDRFRRHIEAAYAAMHERHQRGDKPTSFDVVPIMDQPALGKP